MNKNDETRINPSSILPNTEQDNPTQSNTKTRRNRRAQSISDLDRKKEEILEEIYQEIKQLEAQSWFAEQPKLVSKKHIILTRVLKAIESIIKYSMSFLRLFENHFNIYLEYEIGKMMDKDGKPIMYIKIHKITLPEELNPELTETIVYEKVEEENENKQTKT